MFELLGKDREGLLKRRQRAVEFARTMPEHGLVEARWILETVCRAVLHKADVKPERRRELRNAPLSADEMIAAIAKYGLADPIVLSTMRWLQSVSNYGSHVQEDRTFLGPGFEQVWLAQVDLLLHWHLGGRPLAGVSELSGLTSLEQIATLEAASPGVQGGSASDSSPDTERPPPPHGAERRRAPRGPDEPRSAEQWLARAADHQAGGETELALRDYQRAVHFFLRDGNIERARHYADEVARRDPDKPAHWIQLAEILVTEGNIHEALSSFRKAAALLNKAEELDEFVTVGERVAAFDPEDVATLRALADVYMRKGDPVRALRTFSRWLTVEPRDPEVLERLAGAFESLGHADKAARVRQVHDEIVANPMSSAASHPSRASAAAVSAASGTSTKSQLTWRQRLAARMNWRRIGPWAALVVTIVGAGSWVLWRTRGVPLRDASLALRGDPEHGAAWTERCDAYRRAGQLDTADQVCARALLEPGLTSESHAHLLVGRALILHARGRDHEAAPLLAEAIGLRNETDTREAVQEVCGSWQTAPLFDEVARVLVVPSSSAALTVFSNRAGKTKRYAMSEAECVAITPPVRDEDGSVWVRIARDVAPELASVENDVRYGYVPVAALRPGPTAADRQDCASLSGAGFLSRARLPCERAALAPDPREAAIAAAMVARVWVRSGEPKRALPWLAAALQLDDGTHADEITAQLQDTCAAAIPSLAIDGRRFQIVDWPWDDRAAAFSLDPPTKERQALPTGTCVLPEAASVAANPDNVLVQAAIDGRAVTGFVHRVALRP